MAASRLRDRDTGTDSATDDKGRLAESTRRSRASGMSSKAEADYIRKLLTKLQGHEPTEEEIEEEMGPQQGSSIGGPSGSFVQSMAPLQLLASSNPGNKLIEKLLQIAATRRSEAGA